MSETALTLIKGAMRSIGVIAPGDEPTNAEAQDGLEAMKMMFRHWSVKRIRIPYITQENFALTGANPETIGSGGTLNAVRPSAIVGAYVRDSNGVDSPLDIIEAGFYRALSLKSLSGTPEYLWYSPEYPLGKIYLYPQGGTTIYLDTLKPLTDPSLITSTVSFPPEYDEAIKFQLALRLAPEFGREPSQLVVAMAKAALDSLEAHNFSQQVEPVRPEITDAAGRYNIDEG